MTSRKGSHSRPPVPPSASARRPTLTLGSNPGAGAEAGAAAAEGARRPKPLRIAGLAAVQALFARDPDRVERLFYEERLKAEAGPFCAHLAGRRRPYRMVGPEEMEKVAGTPLHGGIVAVAAPRPVLPFDLADAARWAAAGHPLLLLDGVGNPHNLGAIVRTAAFFGLERLVLSDHPGQALPSDSAYRVAEGGFEHVTLYRATGFAGALAALGAYRTIGTALGGHAPLEQLLSATPQGKPVALVLGNEEQGLPPATQAACAALATIPGSGRVQSLNVSATAAILAYLLTRG